MKLWLVLLACAVASVSAHAADGAAARFSQVVPTEERAALGLTKLSSDQLASLDALVRRDLYQAQPKVEGAAPTTFSQRLTPSEREITGLAALSAEEVAKIDAAVEKHALAVSARDLLASPRYASRAARIETKEKKPGAEIHGSFSLSYGWGKGGYSEKTASALVSVEDPSKRFTLTIGYGQSEIKGDGVRYVEAP